MPNSAHSSLRDLGPLLTVRQGLASIQGKQEARVQVGEQAARDEYRIAHCTSGGVNEYLQIDDEFYASVASVVVQKQRSLAFIGEDWLRLSWMISGSGHQELIPFGHRHVPSYITPQALAVEPGYIAFELQPDSFIKIESIDANVPLKWVSVAMSRRAVQRFAQDIGPHIPVELERYLNADASILMMRRARISSASLNIVRSMFDIPLTGRMRYKFLCSQVHSLMYMALGRNWNSDDKGALSASLQRRIMEGAELLRQYARTAEFSVANVPLQIGISRSQFDHLFQATFGMPPGRYLIEEKMKYAAELLIAEDLPIKEIGIRLGYNRQGSFTRCFARWSKVSPTKFRARHRYGLY